MRTTKIAILLAFMFVTAMAAGAVMGRLAWRQQQPQPAPSRVLLAGAAALSDQLQLSREQSEQMRPIWEEARDTALSCTREAERIQRQHESQLMAMLTDEQKKRYERLSQENHRRIAAQDALRKEAFREAVGRTMKILRPDQRRAYEEIIRNQVGSVPEIGARTPSLE